MIRLFAALDVPPEIADGLARRQQGLPGAKWRPLDSLHITLAFYGEVAEPMAEELDSELGRVQSGPFDVALEGVGSFQDGWQVRAVWAGVRDSEPLRVLAGRCAAAGRRAGARMEARAWRPHVTLAYTRASVDPDRAAAWVQGHALLSSPSWRVGGFALYSSWRSTEGSRYDLERDYPLL
jgi:2'-5' RNA ligase